MKIFATKPPNPCGDGGELPLNFIRQFKIFTAKSASNFILTEYFTLTQRCSARFRYDIYSFLMRDPEFQREDILV